MITVKLTSSYTPNGKESPMKTTLTRNAKEQTLSLWIDCQNGRLGKRLTADEAEHVGLLESLQTAQRLDQIDAVHVISKLHPIFLTRDSENTQRTNDPEGNGSRFGNGGFGISGYVKHIL